MEEEKKECCCHGEGEAIEECCCPEKEEKCCCEEKSKESECPCCNGTSKCPVNLCKWELFSFIFSIGFYLVRGITSSTCNAFNGYNNDLYPIFMWIFWILGVLCFISGFAVFIYRSFKHKKVSVDIKFVLMIISLALTGLSSI